MGHRWYVVRTRPRSEKLAARELDQDNIEVFSPSVKTRSVGSGTIEGPLFPGYILIRLDPESDGWPSFRFGQHALGLLNFGGELPWLPDEVIAELKQQCDRINQVGGVWTRYQPGDWVRVVSSTIQGVAQVVNDGKTPQTPVRVLLQLFERLVPVQVHRHELQPLEESPDEKTHGPRRTRGSGRWIRGFGPRVSATA